MYISTYGKNEKERLIFIFKFQIKYNNNTYEGIVSCSCEPSSQFLWNEKFCIVQKKKKCLFYCTFFKKFYSRRINTFPNIARGTKKYFRSISHCIFHIYESWVSMERYPSIEMGRGSISRMDCLYSRRRKEFQRAFNASCEKNEIISYHVRGGREGGREGAEQSPDRKVIAPRWNRYESSSCDIRSD